VYHRNASIGGTFGNWKKLIQEDNSGNVGIGVTSPSEKLQVDGNIKIEDGGTYPALLFDDVDTGAYIANNANGLFIGKTNSPSSSNDILKLDLTYSKLVTAGGYFEIGGGSSITGILGFNRNISTGAIHNGSYGAYQMQNEGGTFRIQVYNSSGGSVNANAFVIKDTANVGIGVADPSTKLEIAGPTRISGVGNGLIFDTTGSEGSNFIKTINDYETVISNTRGSAGFGVFGNSNIRLGFGTNYTTAETDLFINYTGNVGIGTTSPGEKLEVSGNIKTTAHLVLPYGEINDSATDLNIVGTHAVTLQTSAGTALTIPNASTNVLIGTTNTGWDGDADNLVVGSGSGNNGMTIYAGSTSFSQINFADSNSGAGRYTGVIRYLHSINAMSFYTNDGVEAVRIDSTQDAHFDQDVIAFSTTPSDKRLKTNIKDIDYGLDTIMKLNPKQYDWKKDDRHDIGFIAQEVEEVIPEIVKDKKHFDKEIKTLDYEKLTAVLIKAVQEQQQQINELKEKLSG